MRLVPMATKFLSTKRAKWIYVHRRRPVLPEKVTLTKAIRGAQVGSIARKDTLYVAVKYKEITCRPVRVQPNGCGCDDSQCENSRIRDGYEFGVLDECPEHDPNLPKIEDLIKGPNPQCTECRTARGWFSLKCRSMPMVQSPRLIIASAVGSCSQPHLTGARAKTESL